MLVLPLKKRLAQYIELKRITKQFEKQKRLFEANPFHPSLHTEILKPKHFRIYSFRITKKYRALFVYCGSDTIEIADINDHYK